MSFDSIEAARADVIFAVNAGQAKADLTAVQAQYARTTGLMTDDALKLSIAQERLNRSIAQSGPESYAAAKATVAYRSTVQELAASETAAAAAAQKAAKARLAAYTSAARTVGTTLTRYVTAPTALASAAAVKLAFDFDGSMRLIQTQAGASAGEVNFTSDAILEMVRAGDSFGQTANDMSKGLFAIESEGVRGAKAMEILRVASAGAAVGGTDLAQTADALTSAMRVYDVSADGAAKTQATLNAIVGAGKLHLEDLVAALSTKYLPVAKQLGIPLDQAGAALSIFTKAGIPAESAATNLTTALVKILTPSKSAGENLALLGLNSDELAQELQQGGLTDALGTLSKRYDQLVASQGKVAANKAIFGAFGGTKGGGSILTLVQQYSQYVKGLDQIQQQANPGTFWKAVAVTMHEPANQVHQDIAKISGDLILVGEKLAPLVADFTGFITEVVDEFDKLPHAAKTDLEILLGLLAVGGPLLIAIAGAGRGIETIGRAWTYMSGSATKAVTQSSEELALLRTQAAETAAALEAAGAEGGAGLAAGIGAGVAKSEAELAALTAAETATGAGGLLGGVRGLGRLTGLRAAGTYGLGGLVAGQVLEGVVPGQAGAALGRAAEFAGLGATVGSFFPGPGTAIGAGLGATVGAISALIHEGPSFVQQMDAMGQSIDRFHEATAATAHAVTGLQQTIANARVSRDQAQAELQAAQVEEKATRGTKQHAAAIDRLRAARLNLDAATRQIRTDTDALTKAEHAHQIAIRKTAQAENDQLKELLATGRQTERNGAAYGKFVGELNQARGSTQRYVEQLNALADSAQSSNPKLARVARELVRIAQDVGHIPSNKTITIVYNEVFHHTGQPTYRGIGDFPAATEDPSSKKPKKARRPHVAPFTTTIPIALQINVQRAENAGDTASERRFLQEEKAFLEAELRKKHTKAQELEALQAIGAIDSQLASLTTVHAKAGKSRRQAHLDRVRAEQQKLEINEQRARLAEQRAGQNKHLLDRAYRAERRALQDEINFYRREAHDQQLALRDRQRYAKLQIAAEKAKLKIGKDTARQAAVSKQELAQVAEQLQTILQNFAPNFWSTSTRPDVHVHVNQSFPSAPVDQHRQARHAVMAMRSAFDS